MAGDVPAFRFWQFPKRGLDVLPPPEVPFGLWFQHRAYQRGTAATSRLEAIAVALS